MGYQWSFSLPRFTRSFHLRSSLRCCSYTSSSLLFQGPCTRKRRVKISQLFTARLWNHSQLGLASRFMPGATPPCFSSSSSVGRSWGSLLQCSGSSERIFVGEARRRHVVGSLSMQEPRVVT